MTNAIAYPYILIDSGRQTVQAMAKDHRPAAYDAFMSEQTGRWRGSNANSFVGVGVGVGERRDRIEDGVLMPPKAGAAHRTLAA